MILNKLNKYYNTILYLKPIQIFYQIKKRLKISFPLFKNYNKFNTKNHEIKWQNIIKNLSSYTDKNTFTFLNIKHSFNKDIDWNFNKYHKLWLYNLNYFDFLNQKRISKKDGLALINSFIENYDVINDGKEPYPTSLRLINWVKFISNHNINNKVINEIINKDTNNLIENLEYHLLGNHLLENGFALWFVSIYFHDSYTHKVSKKILSDQLDEQILNDGAHFELSPMYHNLMLYRLLDSINFYRINNYYNDHDLLNDFVYTAEKMCSWSRNILFNNGSIPLVNDCSNEVNPNSEAILNYASCLGIRKIDRPLSDSGYRMIKYSNFELFIDIGDVMANYQPAHTHADTFNFEFYIDNRPIIVDSGTSTYNLNKKRILERSTKAHNTVVISDLNSSDVWSGFRLAKRAKVIELKEDNNKIEASHTGYSNINIKHNRSWTWFENRIEILDKVISSKPVNNTCTAYLHFHPNVSVVRQKNNVIINGSYQLNFKNENNFKLFNYEYCPQFNKCFNAVCIEINFNNNLTTILKTK